MDDDLKDDISSTVDGMIENMKNLLMSETQPRAVKVAYSKLGFLNGNARVEVKHPLSIGEPFECLKLDGVSKILQDSWVVNYRDSDGVDADDPISVEEQNIPESCIGR